MRKRTAKQAFTLIELLVVIAIIAILITIVTPSLARAKRRAESVYCQSNLRQIMLAAVVYTENNNGFFPIAYYSVQNENRLVQYSWDFTVRFTAESPTVEPGILWQGDTIDRIQQCPSFRGQSNTLCDPYTGYNYNTSYIGHGQSETIPQPAKRYSLSRPSGVAIFGDGQSMEGANKYMRSPLRGEGDMSFNGRWAGTQGFRHNQRTNTAWGDGSTTTQTEIFTDIDPARYKQTLDEYNKLNPNTPVGFLSPDNSAYATR